MLFEPGPDGAAFSSCRCWHPRCPRPDSTRRPPRIHPRLLSDEVAWNIFVCKYVHSTSLTPHLHYIKIPAKISTIQLNRGLEFEHFIFFFRQLRVDPRAWLEHTSQNNCNKFVLVS